VGSCVTGGSVTGAGVTGAGVTGAGVTGAGVTGAGVTVTGAGVAVTGAGVSATPGVGKEVGGLLGEKLRGLVGLPVTVADGKRDDTTVGTTLGDAVGLWETLGISVGGTSGISVGDKLDFVGVTVGDKVDEKVGDDEGTVDPVGLSLGKKLGFDDGYLLGLTEADGDADGILVWVSTKAFQNLKSLKSRSVSIAFSRTTL
jgi:hypothetical protein